MYSLNIIDTSMEYIYMYPAQGGSFFQVAHSHSHLSRRLATIAVVSLLESWRNYRFV